MDTSRTAITGTTEDELKRISKAIATVIAKYRHVFKDEHIDSVSDVLDHILMITDDEYGHRVASRVFHDIANFVLQSDMTDTNRFGVSDSLRQVFKLVVEEGKSLLDDDVAKLSPQVSGIVFCGLEICNPLYKNVWFWQERNLTKQLLMLKSFGGTLGVDFYEFVKFYKAHNYNDYIFNVLIDVAG